jgi:UDP-N-acetylglucosamine 4,6-dehydratase
MRSVLITGGTGAFGSAFALECEMAEVDRIVIYSRGEYRQFQMRQQMDSPRFRWFIGDVRDRDRLRRAMQGVEVVVHAAALKRIEVGFYNPIEMVKTNVMGAINVIEAAQDAGVRKVVAISSDKAFQPVSPYGASKALAESLFLSSNNARGQEGPRYAVCRYGNVWNSTGSVVPVWRNMIANGNKEVTVTDPDCTRFFMRMPQAVWLVLETIEKMQGGELRIPELPAYRLGDLAEAMGVEMRITGLPAFEKKHEGMDANNCSKDARRMTVGELKVALEHE